MKKTVCIVGSGFGGLAAAKALAGKSDVQVILIDQRNYHLFQPLLYQVATAGLNPGDIAVPIRAEFSKANNVEVHRYYVEAVNLYEKWIQTESTLIRYDYLILACGAQHSYFGHAEWEENAPGLKTLEQATEIRRRILLAFEDAENEMDAEKQAALLTFVVVGGGPTGVELAGAIADISRTVLVHDFKRVDPSKAKIILIEAGARLVASFSAALSEKTKADLTKMGVAVRTSSRVEKIDGSGVQVGNEFIAARTVIWGAGVQAAKMSFIPAIELDRAGRVKVQKDLSIAHYPNVMVIGDMAAVEIAPNQFVPGLAPAAIQEGKHAAQLILAELRGKSRRDFKYLDKGQMATIGKNRAIVQAGKIRLTGYLAWLAWLFVHIFYLIGFRNRIAVLWQWAWNYIFSKRGARLITEKNWKLRD